MQKKSIYTIACGIDNPVTKVDGFKRRKYTPPHYQDVDIEGLRRITNVI